MTAFFWGALLVAGLLGLGWWRSNAAHGRALAQLRVLAAARDVARQGLDAMASSLDHAREGLVLVDELRRVLVANKPARNLLQASGTEVVGLTVDDVAPWLELRAAMHAVREGGDDEVVEATQPTDGGALIAVHVSWASGLGWILCLEDKARLSGMEALRRDFVANVSHELKTPLTAIKGFTETMQDDPEMPASTRAHFLERVGRQTKRLASLVTDLMTISKLDEQSGIIGTEACDVSAVLHEVIRDLMPLAERSEMALELTTPVTPLYVRGEPEALRQAFGNLVDNAIKYTGEGGSVMVSLASPEPGSLHLEVADTGVGLSEIDQERVFERFFRVDRARSRELGGTGLGLSIVKNTVKNLGGDIGVRSELGVGSVFWLTLPTVPAERVG